MSDNKSIYWLAAVNFCHYRERNHYEVRQKLLQLGARSEELEFIIAELISHSFLNEERYARAFVRGHFNLKHWGRVKIISELRKTQTSEYCIKQGLTEMAEEDYTEKLKWLFEKKCEELKVCKVISMAAKAKIYRFLVQKGYESHLINELLNNYGSAK